MLENITQRESDILKHVIKGKTNKWVASELGIAEGTVKSHVSSLMLKGACESRGELAYRVLTGTIRFRSRSEINGLNNSNNAN